MKQTFLFVLFLFFISCNNKAPVNDNSIEKENELLKKEIELKQKEIELKDGELQKENKPSISELYKTIKKSVFLIYTEGDDFVAQGSGFFIDETGMALSNYHVFKNANQAIVLLDNGRKFMITKIIDSNEDNDYVMFQVGDGIEKFPPLKIASKMPDIGEKCFAVGNPKELSQTLSIGNISGYRNNGRTIQTTTEITHGSSGGALFNEAGEVIGITSGGYGEANLNFAVCIKQVPYAQYIVQVLNYSPENTVTEQNKNEIKEIVQNYYTAVFSKNYYDLNYYFANDIDRYFDKFNITKSQAIEFAKSYWLDSKIKKAWNKIDWSTFNVATKGTESIVTFNMDYFMERVDTKYPTSFNINIVMKLNPYNKITSIYENIISQH